MTGMKTTEQTRRCRRIPLLFLLLLFAAAAKAWNGGDYGQRVITMDDGLLSNTVRNTAQDRYGFIWMGTDNGLCRYDGMSIRSFRIPGNNGVDQYVSALCCMPDGLMVGTARGLYIYHFRTEAFQRVVPEINKVVTHITYDRDGNVWIATLGQGAYCYTPGNGRFRRYPMPSSQGFVDRLLVSNDNQIWAVNHITHPSVTRLNRVHNRFEPVVFKEGQTARTVSAMQARDGTIWFGTWDDGLMRLDSEGSLQQVLPPHQLSSFKHIHCLFDYAPDCILVGCDEGLKAYNPQTGMVNEFPASFPATGHYRFVYSITRDKEGGLWLGTFYGGVGYISPMARRFEPMAGNVISRFCEDGQGRVWIGSDDAGLRCYSPRSHSYEDYKGQEVLGKLNVHALCIDGNDLWVGTYTAGIYVYNLLNGSMRHYMPSVASGLNDASAYTIFRDSRKRIWVATMAGLCVYDRERDVFIDKMKCPSIIIDIDEDRSGNLWMSTQGNGLWRLDARGRWKRYTYAREAAALSDNLVNCVTIDASGHLWVGTQNGLCRYNYRTDGFERISLSIPCQTVSSIIEDQGVLWLAGDCGVVKYEPGTGVCRFTKQDGLVCEQFLPSAGIMSADGRIYFGSTRGFNVFSPYQIKINQIPPPVFITSFNLFNRQVAVGSRKLPEALFFVPEVELSWKDGMFSFSFASLSYCSPEKNQYAYKLDGFDKEWNYVGANNRATYTNIPAGTYTFRVKATNNDGVWGTTEAQLNITVHPPFWWGTPAKVSYLLLVIAAVWYYVHYRLRREQGRHRRELQQLRDTKEKEVRDARLSFFTMIAHEIRTPVSLIIGPLEKIRNSSHPDIAADLNVIDRNAHRLLELVNQLLDFRKVERKDLIMNFAPQNICELLRSVSERFAPTFAQGGKRFTVDYPDARFTAIIDREAIIKVVSNLLTNANKYTKDEVRLRCVEEPDCQHFRIEVTDNGVGIKPEDKERIFIPFYQAQNNKPGTGIGLSIVKDIVTLHHGTISVESSIDHGSAFTVVLPVSQQMEGGGKAPAAGVRAEEMPDAGQVIMPQETAGQEGGQAEGMPKAKSTMLVVDDNEDIVQFLERNFSDTYHVVTAGDGIEALDCIGRLQHADDRCATPGQSAVAIIVSDWMMPRMDGPELCRRIRQDAATSHIPFVMLTAKTDSESKVEGMDVGADAYIEKPFSLSYLQACIRNILELRRMLRERFSTQPLEPVSGIAGNAVDNEFCGRMIQLIEDNFSNPELSVVFLADKLNISRSGLFSKLKGLADLTPNEMIQVVRLKKAAQLLREGNYQVGQVCYMVGFSNPSYFSKCFYKQFGIRPADFVKQGSMPGNPVNPA